MNKNLTFLKSTLSLVLVFLTAAQVFSQSTFTTVYTILQTNCAGSGCHSGMNANTFSVDGTENDVYNSIVGVDVENTLALERGDKLVYAGHPYKSFLLKKIGGNFDSYLALHTNDGDIMPNNNLPELQDHEIELVRQWIQAGAQKSGKVVDYQLIQDYYTDGGLATLPIPDAPAPSEGFQIRYGPIFIAPGDEVEFMKQENLNNTETLKIYKLDGVMAWQSHHMLLFKTDGLSRQGTRQVPNQSAPFNNGSLTNGWQSDNELNLPPTTALFWGPNTTLDFDYHIKNYSNTQILPTDFYLNVFFTDDPDRNIEMKASLENQLALFLSQGIQNRVSTHNFNEDRYLWLLTSHTHKYGTDYDIFERKQDGSKGDQLYEGFFNLDYSFNQGFYDWEDPAIRFFEPLRKVSNGLIYDVTYDVKQPFVTFGLTTDGEMMLFTYLYTTEPVVIPAGIAGDIDGNNVIDGNEIAGDLDANGIIDGNELTGDLDGNGLIDGDELLGDANGNGVLDNGEVTGINDINSNLQLQIAPNPSNGVFTLFIPTPLTSSATLSVFNMLGEEVINYQGIQIDKTLEIDLTSYGSGAYFIQLTSNEINQVRKVIVN